MASVPVVTSVPHADDTGVVMEHGPSKFPDAGIAGIVICILFFGALLYTGWMYRHSISKGKLGFKENNVPEVEEEGKKDKRRSQIDGMKKLESPDLEMGEFERGFETHHDQK